MGIRYYIPKGFRNCGSSFGLEYPYIFGKVGGGRQWAVWHRHTGLIEYCADEHLHHPDQNDIFNRQAAYRVCARLNGCSEYPSAEVLAEIDATP